nr:transporter substrate-binding domain-containing protein [Neiella litorisoli]
MAAAHWCPYICGDDEYPGIAVEYIRTLLGTEQIQLTVTILPWTRAIRMTEKGRFDGLLTAVPEEAPTFIFTGQQSGDYQMCFYRRKGDSARYIQIEDLSDLRLGVIQDYGYGEPLDSYIADHKNSASVVSVAHENSLSSLAEMLRLKRIDLLIEDPNVVAFNLTSAAQDSMAQAGCLSANPFYTAFSPAVVASAQRQQVLDRLLAKPESKAIYQQILRKYRQRQPQSNPSQSR